MVDDIDEPRQRDLLLAGGAAADLGRPIQGSPGSRAERDRALADLLQAVVLQAHVVVEVVGRPRTPPRQLDGKVAQVEVETLQIGVLIGDHLAQKPVQVAQRVQLAAPLLGLRFILLQERGEAGRRRVQRGVERLMIRGALALPGLEVRGAEAFDFFGEVHAGGIELGLDRVHPGGIDLGAQLRAFIVGGEGGADLVAVIDEVEDEGVFLERVGAVEPRQRLHRLDAGEPLVDVHRMEQRLIEAGLILLGHQQHLILRGREAFRQLLLAHAGVHLFLGVGRAGDPVVLDRARKRDQRLDRIALARDIAVEALLEAHRLQPRPGDHHRLGAPADPVAGDGVEVLDHDLGLLRDVVRVQLQKARERLGGVLPLHLRVVRALLEQPVVGGIGGVVPQHVEDESLLDRLTHRVAVRGLAAAPEDLERLVLGRRREGKAAQVGLPAALGHAQEQRLRVLAFQALAGRAFVRFGAQLRAAEHLLERGRGLAPLGAVRFVDDHRAAPGRQHPGRVGAALLGHAEQLPGDERELLQRGDDDRRRALQRLRELARILVDLAHHAALVLELVDGVLQLLIEHHAVGHHDHAVEHAGVVDVVQRRQAMREPGDRIALAAARRVFDQGVVADALAARGGDQEAHRFELVIAGEDHRLHLRLAAAVVALLRYLQVDEARQQVEQAVALQHLLPQVRGAVAAAVGVGRIAGAAVAAPVEGQEARSVTGKPRRHQHRLGIHGEVDQGAPLEGEDRRPRVAVRAVLPAGVRDRLSGERVLQFQGGDRNAVDAQRHVERLLGVRREAKLARDAGAVGGVARVQLRVQIVRGLEERRVQGPAVALEPVPERRQGAVRVQPGAQIAQDLRAGLRPEQRFEPTPFRGLRPADEVERRVGKDGALPVEGAAGNRHVAVRQQVRFDHRLERRLAGPLHHRRHRALRVAVRFSYQTGKRPPGRPITRRRRYRRAAA